MVAHTTKTDINTHDIRLGANIFPFNSYLQILHASYRGLRWTTIFLSLPADDAVPHFPSIILFLNFPISLDKKGFNTLRSLLSGCLYSRLTAPCDQLGLICSTLFQFYLVLHKYLEFNTHGLTLDLFGFIDCIYIHHFPAWENELMSLCKYGYPLSAWDCHCNILL